MTTAVDTTASQTADQVVAVMQQIAQCDFRTGLYTNTTHMGELTWVGFAQHGDGHRFFTIHDAGGEVPLIRVLSKDQSMMHFACEPADVDVTDIDYDVTLAELTAGGFASVRRLLGLGHLADEAKRIRSRKDTVPTGR